MSTNNNAENIMNEIYEVLMEETDQSLSDLELFINKSESERDLIIGKQVENTKNKIKRLNELTKKIDNELKGENMEIKFLKKIMKEKIQKAIKMLDESLPEISKQLDNSMSSKKLK